SQGPAYLEHGLLCELVPARVPLPSEKAGKVLTLEVLHHEIRHTFGRDSEVGNVDYVVVLYARGHFSLLYETFGDLRHPCEIAGQHLDGDLLPYPGVFGQVEVAHAALAYLLIDQVSFGYHGTYERIAVEVPDCIMEPLQIRFPRS